MTQQIEFQYFDAIEPHQIEGTLQNIGVELKNCSLTKGEIGCFLSHVSLWKKIIDNNLSYMAIFEDDIYLGDDASFYLNSHDWIDPDWNIIKIEAFNERVLIGKPYVQLEKGSRSISKLKSCNLGTAGYILSIKGA